MKKRKIKLFEFLAKKDYLTIHPKFSELWCVAYQGDASRSLCNSCDYGVLCGEIFDGEWAAFKINDPYIKENYPEYLV